MNMQPAQGQPQGAPLPMPPQQAQMGHPSPAAPPAPMMGGAPPPMPVTIDGVMRLLRDNAERRFRIDIEADSTIAGDEAQEKQDRTGLIEALTKLIETWGPIVMAQPLMAPLAGELMQFGVRAYRVGRSLEQIIDETVEKFIEAAGQPKPPPQPSPDEMIKLKGIVAKVQAEIAKAQIGVEQAKVDAQASMADHHVSMAATEQQRRADAQGAANDAAQTNLEAGHDRAKALMDAEIEQARYQRAMKAQNAPTKE